MSYIYNKFVVIETCIYIYAIIYYIYMHTLYVCMHICVCRSTHILLYVSILFPYVLPRNTHTNHKTLQPCCPSVSVGVLQPKQRLLFSTSLPYLYSLLRAS